MCTSEDIRFRQGHRAVSIADGVRMRHNVTTQDRRIKTAPPDSRSNMIALMSLSRPHAGLVYDTHRHAERTMSCLGVLSHMSPHRTPGYSQWRASSSSCSNCVGTCRDGQFEYVYSNTNASTEIIFFIYRQHGSTKKDCIYNIQVDSSSQLAHSTVTIHVKHCHEMYNFCNKEISALTLGNIKLYNELFECLNTISKKIQVGLSKYTKNTKYICLFVMYSCT